MHKFQILIRYSFVLSIALFVIGGCAPSGVIVSHNEDATPDQLIREARYYFDNGYYRNVRDALQMILDRYPYSKHCTEAELKMADSMYHNESYDEALDAYNEFQRMHPKNTNISYILYQKGMCNFMQLDSIDRDQLCALHAKEAFQILTKRFPESEYTEKAYWKIRECYMSISGAELYVANFYYKIKRFRAAMIRYRYVLKNYPDLGQYHMAIDGISKCEIKIAEECF